MAARPAEAGFSLVEMMVALMIFAIIAGAGVGLLRASVDTQAAVEGRLAEVSELGRLHALLAGDLGQAVARPGRTTGQFTGEAGRMAFVRAGWSNLDGSPRSDLQRVEWRFSQHQLVRTGHSTLAGGGPGVDAAFARDVQDGSMRYRLADGSWASAFASTPEQPLPVAVELRFARSGEMPLTLVLGLGSRGSSPP